MDPSFLNLVSEHSAPLNASDPVSFAIVDQHFSKRTQMTKSLLLASLIAAAALTACGKKEEAPAPAPAPAAAPAPVAEAASAVAAAASGVADAAASAATAVDAAASAAAGAAAAAASK
jgi:hypothetical protein